MWHETYTEASRQSTHGSGTISIVKYAIPIAIVPVVVVTAVYGERGTADLLVFSQVVLSLQLPFAVVPLVLFVTDRRKMGPFTVGRPLAALAWGAAAMIIALNLKLLWDTVAGGAA